MLELRQKFLLSKRISMTTIEHPLPLVTLQLTIDQIINAISQPRGKHEVLVYKVYYLHKSSGSDFV